MTLNHKLDQVRDEYLRRLAMGDVAMLRQIERHIASRIGKMLRPQLLLMSAATLGDEAFDSRRTLLLAVAVEMLHNASLLHDDVIDRADSRRGQASVNARFGNTAAVLAGDYLLAQVMGILHEVNDPDAAQRINRTVIAMVEAELLQMEGHEVLKSQGHEVLKSQGHEVIKSQGHEVLKSQGHEVIKSQGHEVLKSQGHEVMKSQGHEVLKSQGHEVSTTPRLHDSTTPRLHDSTTPRLHDSTTPRLHDSTTPRPHDSTTPRLHDPTTPRPHDSTTPRPHDPTTPRPHDPTTYLRIIDGKTASLFATACALGNPDYEEFGLHYGRLFQLRDDQADHEDTPFTAALIEQEEKTLAAIKHTLPILNNKYPTI